MGYPSFTPQQAQQYQAAQAAAMQNWSAAMQASTPAAGQTYSTQPVAARAPAESSAKPGSKSEPKEKGKGKGGKSKAKSKSSDKEKAAPAEDKAEQPEKPAPDKEFSGTLKSHSEKNGYGFIACEEVFKSWKRDTWVDGEQLPENV